MTDSGGWHLQDWLRGLFGQLPAHALPDLVQPAGEDPLVWVRIGNGYRSTGAGDAPTVPPALIQLLIQLQQCGLRVVVSHAAGAPPDLKTQGVSAIPDAARSMMQVEAHLRALNPAAILLVGSELPPPLIEVANARHIPIVMTEAILRPPLSESGRRSRSDYSAHLSRLSLLLLPDAISRDAALTHGVSPLRVELTGPITHMLEPPRHNEAERTVLTDTFQGRQIWLAVCVNKEEEDAVINAHLTALRYSHRAMLIILPANPCRSEALAARMAEAGLIVAQRNLEEEPTEEVNAYLTDDLYELGLWYRLAALCFMGTTLAGSTTAARDPFEAALLGSAAIHGPQDGPYTVEWMQLDGANAAYPVQSPAALTDAVVMLLAPDRAAQLATNAWAVSTGGAEVANRIAHAVRSTITGNTA